MSILSTVSAPPAQPQKRSPSVLQRSRQLVRRISLSMLSSRDRSSSRPPPPPPLPSYPSKSSLPSSANTSTTSLPRSRSRLGVRLRRHRTSPVPPVPPLPKLDEALVRSSTPQGSDSKTINGERRRHHHKGKSKKAAAEYKLPVAHVLRGSGKEYDLRTLVDGRRVNELWFPGGDTLVYLCSREESDRYEPSFRVSSVTLRRKSEFFKTALSERWQVGSGKPEGEGLYRLFFPTWGEDEDSDTEQTPRIDCEADYIELVKQFVATRNLFAYLFGRRLVSLEAPHDATLLSDLCSRLELYVFSSTPSSSAARELGTYIRKYELDDTRKSVHRLPDILHVSALYGWEDIYKEAFIHAAGLFDTISSAATFADLPSTTRQLLERASLSLKANVANTASSLSTLRFPVPLQRRQRARRRPASSRSTQLPVIPKGWKNAYDVLRAMTIEHYSRLFRIREWPPRRWSRGMALQMYRDFDAVYELIRDTTPPGANEGDPFRLLISSVLKEFFEVTAAGSKKGEPLPPPLPRLPALPNENSPGWNRKQSIDAISATLADSYNILPEDRDRGNFVRAFKELERRYGAGKTVTKSIEAREGRWCFVVAVRRTLESVVGQAEWAGLRYEWGAEWWLATNEERVGEAFGREVGKKAKKRKHRKRAKGEKRKGKSEGEEEERSGSESESEENEEKEKMKAKEKERQKAEMNANGEGSAGDATAGTGPAGGTQQRSIFGG